jgi:pimeloyl-ACP methyl ester carboxylesterase
MKLLAWLVGCWGVIALPSLATAADTVVLLHGLGRTSFSMARLAGELKREGYHVLNISYPSRTQSLETLATEWLPARLRPLPPTEKIHFVTHSMGGIVVRLWLREQGIPANLGRVVMLAPPNAGSEVPDRFAGFPPFRWFTGQNGRRLTTAPDALPRALGPWPANGSELGIIAGDRPLNPLMASWLPKPNDGKVTVATTHLAGARDHVVVPYSHTWLAWRRDTIAQVKAFLREGHFARAAKPVGQIENDSQEPRYSAVGK